MTPELAFECLLISHNAGLRSTIKGVLDAFSISVDDCLTPARACEIFPSRNHELIMIDWNGDSSLPLLQVIWNSPNRRKPTVLAMSGDALPIPGVHFVMRKPITSGSATESLKSAYRRMLWDYRLKARYAVMSRLTGKHADGRTLPLTVTDIGEGGVGISSREKLVVGDELCFALNLPNTPRPVHIQARVIWIRSYGTAGCDFLNIPPVDRDVLRDWLKAKTQVKKPLISV